MSNIVFHCPKCGQKIKAPDIMAGEVGDCPSCKTPIIIPTLPKKPAGEASPGEPAAAAKQKTPPPGAQWSVTVAAPPKQGPQKPAAQKPAAVRPAPPQQVAPPSGRFVSPEAKGTAVRPLVAQAGGLVSAPALPRMDEPPPPPPPPPPVRLAPEAAVPSKTPVPAPPKTEVAALPRPAAPAVPRPAGAVRPEPMEKPAPPPLARERAAEETARPAPAPQREAEQVPRRRTRPASSRPGSGIFLGEKPAALALVPALFSLLPGLGQAFNLNVKKAGFFAALFLLSMGISIFKAGLGLPILILVVFLAMSDAYGSALGKGFFGGFWRGIGAVWRGYFGLLGVLVWTLMVVLITDSVVCWLKAGTSIAAVVNLTGGAAESRTVNNLIVAMVALGAGLLCFFFHGFGRKFLWARRKPWHFLYVVRIVAAGAAIGGLLASVTRMFPDEAGKTVAGKVLSFPPALLKIVLNAPKTMGESLEKTWPALLPGSYDRVMVATTGFGAAATASFTAYPKIYNYLLVGGLAGFLVLFLGSVARVSRGLPGFSEWINLWLDAVRDRTVTMREEWDAFRAERVAAWQQKRELQEARQGQFVQLTQLTNKRLERLEAIAGLIAEQIGIEAVPPPVEVAKEEALAQAAAVSAASAGVGDKWKTAQILARAAGAWGLDALGRLGGILRAGSAVGLAKAKEGVQMAKEKWEQKKAEKAAKAPEAGAAKVAPAAAPGGAPAPGATPASGATPAAAPATAGKVEAAPVKASKLSGLLAKSGGFLKKAQEKAQEGAQKLREKAVGTVVEKVAAIKAAKEKKAAATAAQPSPAPSVKPVEPVLAVESAPEIPAVKLAPPVVEAEKEPEPPAPAPLEAEEPAVRLAPPVVAPAAEPETPVPVPVPLSSVEVEEETPVLAEEEEALPSVAPLMAPVELKPVEPVKPAEPPAPAPQPVLKPAAQKPPTAKLARPKTQIKQAPARPAPETPAVKPAPVLKPVAKEPAVKLAPPPREEPPEPAPVKLTARPAPKPADDKPAPIKLGVSKSDDGKVIKLTPTSSSDGVIRLKT